MIANGTGQYQVRVTASDNFGATASSEGWALRNPQPTVSFPSGAVSVGRGQNLSVTATANDPAPTSGPLSYSWTVVQDGNTILGPIVSSSPNFVGFIPTGADVGAAEVRVTVTDPDGGSASASKAIDIVNSPPEAFILSDPETTLISTEQGTWTFTSSSNDPDGTVAWVGWEITGPGPDFATPTDTPTPVLTDYEFDGYGNYTVRLLVTDDNGATTTTQMSIRLNEPPTAVITAPVGPIRVGDPVVWDGTASFDDTAIAEGGYFWEVFGLSNQSFATIETDAPASPDRPVITINELGTNRFEVRLRVLDEDGTFSTVASVPIDVVN
jgi:hypothetical protein